MPRPANFSAMPAEERRGEIIAMLAAAVVRLRSRPGSLARGAAALSENSPTALALPPSSCTYVTGTENVVPETESQTMKTSSRPEAVERNIGNTSPHPTNP